jgi:regulator of protease activity HflC (stomatin/prohibitin superfamily)
MGPSISSLVVVIVVGVLFLASAIKIIPEYERVVILRLGRLSKGLVGGNGPGLIIIIPGVDRAIRVDIRVITMDVPPQEAITRDNVPVKVNAVIYFRVIDPQKAIIQVENFTSATFQIAQTTLRSVLGQSELDELLAQREKLNQRIQSIVDDHTEPWGIKVSTVEIKDVEVPATMQRAMAKQAEAERERRAKIIAAEGEFQASQKLADAAEVISVHPIALQLRFLQTLVEIGSEHNTTTIFPVPIDLFTPFLKQIKGDKT